MNTATPERRYLSGPEIRKRYNDISAMTHHRWRKDPNIAFPEPEMKIGNRNFYCETAVIEWERRRAKLTKALRSTSDASAEAA